MSAAGGTDEARASMLEDDDDDDDKDDDDDDDDDVVVGVDRVRVSAAESSDFCGAPFCCDVDGGGKGWVDGNDDDDDAIDVRRLVS
jgi:hypothetical protein